MTLSPFAFLATPSRHFTRIRVLLAFFLTLTFVSLADARQEQAPPPAQSEEQHPPPPELAQTFLLDKTGAAETPQPERAEPAPDEALPDAPRQLPLQAHRMTFGERFHIYRHSLVNPDSMLSPAFGAAIGQANNEPPEWGQGASGYGTRLASGYGRLVISRTIRFGVAAIDHEDPRYSPSNEAGFWRRFRYASIHYVIVPTDDGSGQMPAFSRFAGAYGAAFIANSWYPESRANTGHAVMRGSTALAAGWAWHVFREFWPDVRNAIHHHKNPEED